MSQNDPLTDWVNLPANAKETSLWDCLHDADIEKISSDLYRRSLQLIFDVSYLRSFHHLPESMRFHFDFKGVLSVRAIGSVPWPGPVPKVNGLPFDQQNAIVENYQSKWRDQSLEWTSFEASLNLNSGEVLDASLATGTQGQLAFSAGIIVNDAYQKFFIRAESLHLTLGGQEPTTIDWLLDLGSKYWEAFANRSLNS